MCVRDRHGNKGWGTAGVKGICVDLSVHGGICYNPFLYILLWFLPCNIFSMNFKGIFHFDD